MPRLLAAFAALCLFAVAAGCGGDDGTTVSTQAAPTPTPTSQESAPAVAEPEEASREELVAELNRLCKAGNERIKRVQARFQEAIQKQDFEEAAEQVSQGNEMRARFIEDLREMTAPAELEQAFGDYRESVERTQAITERLESTLRAGDVEEVPALAERIERTTADRLDAAIELGADQCGK